ncbi:efflux RND transporter periplasmic adaptor subunit [Maridesulfovibrio sp.]|uniref:efflux RND transporter periplasmic adaptor subunit n=1 Tax=Maridesulfovibrio sp. TaxID=2795000 RepID=UPI0039F0F8D5
MKIRCYVRFFLHIDNQMGKGHIPKIDGLQNSIGIAELVIRLTRYSDEYKVARAELQYDYSLRGGMRGTVILQEQLSIMRTPSDAEKSIRILSVLQKLSLESLHAKNAEELVFSMLNRTVSLCGYDRALFFEQGVKRLKLKGISGQSAINKTSEMVEQWNSFAAALNKATEPCVLSEEHFPENIRKYWQAYVQKNGGISVIWFPLTGWGKHVGGLWFERWGSRPWNDQEQNLLSHLIAGYSRAWERLHPKHPLADKLSTLAGKKLTLLLFAAVVATLLLVRLPLRVVAPSEVIADDPFIVSAPLNGVIAEVKINPGDKVTKGQILFEYDQRTAVEELKVAREQVLIIESSLDRARMQAFADARARSEIAILEHRLDQEQARFKLAEHNIAMLKVHAEKDGVAVIADPEKWRGRPVFMGERVLSVVDPSQTKVRIWIPEDDNMDFDFNVPVRTMLNVMPESVLPGKLEFVGSEVEVSPQRVASVLAEAEWKGDSPDVKIGLKGTTVIYGEKVSLGYWLFRKPWAAFNAYFGF